ncbi:MAG TPA: ABC transporter permease, partial [Chryseolinea sp.]|nr:ABC transporter permease [Chryseolinea sp.]
MLHQFKITWRNLVKDRQFTLLNLLGLSTGLACSFLIYLWIVDELKVDKYNAKDAQLYQVLENINTENGIRTITGTAGLLGKALAEETPGIEYSASVLPSSWFPFKGVINAGETHLKADAQYVSAHYFDIFSVDITKGSKAKFFEGTSSVMISDEFAQKLFHTNENAVGKMVKWDQSEFGGVFQISGVFKKPPSTATEKFDLIFNYALVLERRPNLLNYTNSDPSTFVLLKKGVNLAALNLQIKDFPTRKNPQAKQTIFLAKFSDRYLHGNYENGAQVGGRIVYVQLFAIIALIILVIACINFMNLSTAKASLRLKEIGIKKVVGATRATLIRQFIGESMLMTFLSLLVAIVFIVLLLPVFNEITGKALHMTFSFGLAASVLGITLLTALVAGSYPAFYLSRFNPVFVLKGKLATSFAELMVRKGLVVFQFTLTVIFIAAVLIVYRQLHFIQSKNLGYSRDHIIHFDIPLENDSAQLVAASTFVQSLNRITGVVSASSYYHNLTGDHGMIAGFEWPGKTPGMDIEFSNLEVGYNFLETAGIRMKEGRNFSQTSNASNEIIFNETAIRQMGLRNPVGKRVKFWGMEREIIGVAADFNFESLYQPMKPCFFQVYPVMPNVMVRINAAAEVVTIASIARSFN